MEENLWLPNELCGERGGGQAGQVDGSLQSGLQRVSPSMFPLPQEQSLSHSPGSSGVNRKA